MSRLQNEELKNGVQGSMQTGQGLQLPFVAPLVWWKNGEIALKATKEVTDARRFGGWGVSEEEIVNADIDLPENWHLFEMNGTKGSYNAYLARFIYVAPIDRRFAWFQKPDGKWTTKLNILCYMAEMSKEEKTMFPWGPVVLTAKGFSGMNIDNAFKKFSADTAKLRDGDPVNYFYHALGTFTKEPVFEMATGKGGASSSITPCQLFLPSSGLTAEEMDRYFVGDDIAAKMVEYRKDAKEWLADWNKKDKTIEEEQEEIAPLPDEDGFPY